MGQYEMNGRDFLGMGSFSIVRKAQQSSRVGRPQLDLIALTLRGKKIGFQAYHTMNTP